MIIHFTAGHTKKSRTITRFRVIDFSIIRVGLTKKILILLKLKTLHPASYSFARRLRCSFASEGDGAARSDRFGGGLGDGDRGASVLSRHGERNLSANRPREREALPIERVVVRSERR